MNKYLTKKIAVALFGSALLTLGVAQGADFPNKSVNYVIPFGPGGESDITARHQQAFFKDYFGEDLVITYKPGGGGALGWASLNSMKGDGHNIMGINLPHIVIKPQQADVGFKTEDLVGIYMFHYTPDAIVVRKDSPFQSVADLITYAKANPRKLTFSGSGKGTANHLAQISFDKAAGIETTYVSFKGTGKAVTALLGQQVKAEWGYTSVGMKHKDKVRLLAVATEKRHPSFPDVPTFKELGFNIVSGAYRGIAVPKSTPEEIRIKLSDMIHKINQNPEFKKRMESDGMKLLNVQYKDYQAFLAEQAKSINTLAKQAGVIQ